MRRVDKTDEMDEESSHKTGETQRMAMPRIESTSRRDQVDEDLEPGEVVIRKDKQNGSTKDEAREESSQTHRTNATTQNRSA